MCLHVLLSLTQATSLMDTPQPHRESLYRVTLYLLRRCSEMPLVRINVAAAEMERVDGTDPESVFADGVEFLQRLGVIEYRALDDTGTKVIDVQLTASARHLLSSRPRELVTHSSLGDKIVAVSKSGSKRAVEETMGLLVRTIANAGSLAAAISLQRYVMHAGL
jgi:hypothetical protein